MSPKATRSRPTTLMLVRHGHTATTGKVLPGRAKGLHLDDQGRDQAAAVGRHLAGLGNGKDPAFEAVYASPLERTRETAAALAKALGLRVRTDRRLLEADIGDWTGKELKVAARTKEWKVIQTNPSSFRFPGGESVLEMQSRMVAAAERIRVDHPGGTVIAVSHADPIKSLVAYAMGAHLDQYQRFVISPCSVTTIAFGAEGSTTVLGVNWIPEAVARPS